MKQLVFAPRARDDLADILLYEVRIVRVLHGARDLRSTFDA